MEPKRIAVKIPTADPEAGVELAPFIPLFHGFIQRGSLEGLLIDVADYAHVPNGPGVVLIGHEADYAIDSTGGRTGLLVVRKRGDGLSLAELLTDVFRRALAAAQAIEQDGSVGVDFDLSQIEVQILDRLWAHDGAARTDAALGALQALAGRLWSSGARVARAPVDDPREPLALEIAATEVVDAKTLLDRLGGPARATAESVPGPAAPGQTEWDVSAEQLAHMRERGDDFVLLDVREHREVEICEIGGRVIPLGELGGRMDELEKGAHIVVHCHVGGRSAAAVNALRGAGFENVWNLQGGIRAWIQRIDPSLTDY